MSKGVWQRFDSHGEVAALVVKAYAVSLLLLASVLLWTVGDDLWAQYAYSTRESGFHTSNFSDAGFSSHV